MIKWLPASLTMPFPSYGFCSPLISSFGHFTVFSTYSFDTLPCLAALTVHCQTYFNSVQDGQLRFKIQDLHHCTALSLALATTRST